MTEHMQGMRRAVRGVQNPLDSVEHRLRDQIFGQERAIESVVRVLNRARFGFSASLTTRLMMPGPVDRSRFQALELVPGALQGAAGMLVASGDFAAPSIVGPSFEEIEAFRIAA